MKFEVEMLREKFFADGFQVIDDSDTFKLANCLKDSIIHLLIKRSGLELTTSLSDCSIDSLYNRLHSRNSSISGGIYDVIKELPEFLDLINCASLKSLARELFHWQKIHLPFGLCQFRIDRPMDSKYQFDWHQDYTFNIMSKSAVTFWVPLTDVSLETGAIQILPGSHLHLHPVSGSRNYEPGKDGNAASHLTFKLFEPNIPHFEAKSIQVPIKSGQVLMFHSHVLHRSGHNLSNGLNRWVAIFRMGDLYDGSFMERNFFCARPNKPQTMAGFSSVHPDYFVEKSDIST